MALSWAQSYFIICELGNWQIPIQSWIWYTVMLKFFGINQSMWKYPMWASWFTVLVIYVSTIFLSITISCKQKEKKNLLWTPSHFRCAFDNLKFLICVCVRARARAYICVCLWEGQLGASSRLPSMTQVLETSLSHQAWQHMPSPTKPSCCGQ